MLLVGVTVWCVQLKKRVQVIPYGFEMTCSGELYRLTFDLQRPNITGHVFQREKPWHEIVIFGNRCRQHSRSVVMGFDLSLSALWLFV